MGILNLFSSSKGEEETKLKTEVEEVSNEKILQELDALGIWTKELLKRHKHKLLFVIFCYLFAYDLKLRKRISSFLAPLASNNESNYDEKDIADIIELQSYFNNFRVSILSDLTVYFTELYQVASEIVEKEKEELVLLGTQIFNAAKKIDQWYIQQIHNILKPRKDKTGKINEQWEKMYQECLNVFEEIKEAGLITMKKVLHSNTELLKA